MKLERKEGLYEISIEEMQSIDGGSIVGDAIAVLTYLGACAVAGFNAGRQFVRDMRECFSDTEEKFIIVEGEPI